jgi:hypothetical protein
MLQQLLHQPKEIEKGQVGDLWADRSAGRCVFTMVFKLDNEKNMAEQINSVLRKKT